MENQNQNQNENENEDYSKKKIFFYVIFIIILIISNIVTYIFIKNSLEVKLREYHKTSETLPYCKKEIVNNFQDEDYINYIMTYNQVASNNINSILPSITLKPYNDILNRELIRLEKESKEMSLLYKAIYNKDYIATTEKEVKMLTDQPFSMTFDIKVKDNNDQNTVISLFRGSLEMISKNYYVFALSSKNTDISKKAQEFFDYKEVTIKNIEEANLSLRNN